MFFAKSLFCRGFQAALRISMPFQPYREPEVLPSWEDLGHVLKEEAIQMVLIVTGNRILGNGLVAPLKTVLTEHHVAYTIFSETLPNPTEENVETALAQYHRHNCDCLIAIGGGSPMDCAKAVGARVAYPNKTIGQMKGLLGVLRKIPTLIAIPTTAGTGSEATLAAVITDSISHRKYALMSYPLIPRYALLDAALTYSLPTGMTATTGMDALTHAVEAYIGHYATRQTRVLALEAVKLIFDNIEIACTDSHNHRARENMLHAAYKAGVAFSQSSVGYIHAIAHSLGGQYGTPHGLANAVLMPYVLESYGKSAYNKLHQLGIAAGVCGEHDSPEAGAKAFIRTIRELNSRIGIPETLPGIQEADIPMMAKHAEQEANPLYPVPKLMTAKELEAFYHQVADWR